MSVNDAFGITPFIKVHTDGREQWFTEAEACAALDARLAKLGLFNVYSEVQGQYLQPKFGRTKEAAPRIDRVLVPKHTLCDRGWNHGCIGVEVKRSGARVGPALSQMLDYRGAVWRIDPVRDIWICLSWVMLWPASKEHGEIASLLAQNRLGTIDGEYGGLRFASGETVLARFNQFGDRDRISAANNGRRQGSR